MTRMRNLGLCGMIALWCCLGCYENQEGCLDAQASNFDVGADEDCCCEYPTLTLNIAHQMNGETFSLGTAYYNKSDRPFVVNAVHFYLSDVALLGQRWQGIDDSITIGTQHRPDDALAMSRTSFQYQVGHFSVPGTYQGLRFQLGLGDAELSASDSQFEGDHNLSTLNNPLWTETDGYLLCALDITTDTITDERINIEIPMDDPIAFELPYFGEKTNGENLIIALSIDYGPWLNEVHFQVDDLEVIKAKIRIGMSESIDTIL